LKPAVKGHTVHLRKSFLKSTIQEHTISWKLCIPRAAWCASSLPCLRRQGCKRAVLKQGNKTARLSGPGRGRKRREERKKGKSSQASVSLDCGKEQKVCSTSMLAIKDKRLQSSRSNFGNKSLAKRKKGSGC